MANKAVALYQSVRINGKWTFRKVPEQRLRRLSEGKYHVSWYEGTKKKMEPVGAEPDVARAALARKEKELAFVATGGKVEQKQESQRFLLKDAVEEFLGDCKDRVGRSGYGMAKKSVAAYKYRLGFLIAFDGLTRLDEIDIDYVKRFRKYLREHPDELGDRTCFNIMATVNTFLRTHEVTVGGKILAEMSFPPKPILHIQMRNSRDSSPRVITERDLSSSFSSTAWPVSRKSPIPRFAICFLTKASCIFSRNLHRAFRLKGKRSQQSVKGRKVPIPSTFMAALREFCQGKHPGELLFPNTKGRPEGHFLRKCESIAKRAGFENWQDFELHRFRKTGATRHHENGVSVRKIQSWLGHESLDVTLAYLGVEDAADEYSQEQVNTGALAAFA